MAKPSVALVVVQNKIIPGGLINLIIRQVSRFKSQSFAELEPRIATTRFLTSGSLHDTTRAIWRTGATNSSSMFSISVLRLIFFTSAMMSSLLFSQLEYANIMRSRAKSWLPSKGCSRSSKSFRKLDNGCLTYCVHKHIIILCIYIYKYMYKMFGIEYRHAFDTKTRNRGS